MSNGRITDLNALTAGKVWALLRYGDNSEFCFQTTLNPDILRDLGITLEEGKLPRLDKQYYLGGRHVYRQFAVDAAQVTLWDSLTYTHRPSYEMHPFL